MEAQAENDKIIYVVAFIDFLEKIGNDGYRTDEEILDLFEQRTTYKRSSRMGGLFKAFVAGMDAGGEIVAKLYEM